MPALPDDRKRLGARGEAIVRLHLERLGWRILAANFRSAHGEIDLIAEEGDDARTLVFLEVKTRRNGRHGAPAEAVNSLKQRRLIATARDYLAQRDAGGEEPACRFDIAEVSIGPDGLLRVELLRAVFGDGF